MIQRIQYSKILFLDIETVPQTDDWNLLSERTQALWEKKTAYQRNNNEISPEEFYHERAGIMAEFGKIVCISVGIVVKDSFIHIKSFYEHDEKKLLEDFNSMLIENFFKPDHILCAHNGKEFDFPYIARRMMINQIEIPAILQLFGKKPWEVQHLDTMELWKFGDYKNFTSLDLLANVFEIPTPKDDIDGSQVARVYYDENNVERIKDYCEKDVVTLINVFRKMRYDQPLQRKEDI
ncbi:MULTISPECIES: 3'-5' exonuclease [Empedobacter]|uniref:3'-5' exonuclease n=1 Tax=Empedobacter falsenii TaxID=343874 RepID=A0A427BTM9_9FLAO|nr:MULTISPECIES: 3'-5' exonuclease [Empedobacter]MDH0660693.1 3'-5' exonuclease [Empedobacter sp. GD03865]RRT94206.1 3'-5' exonuclease [Empedobacter falsenii]RRT94400.1 3'-5' exonuclease [Empedobacter falsenii]